MNIDKSSFSKENVTDFEFFRMFVRLTVPRTIDQFGRKRYQKKHKDVSIFTKVFCCIRTVGCQIIVLYIRITYVLRREFYSCGFNCIRVFSKTLVGCQKFVQYIRMLMLYPGRSFYWICILHHSLNFANFQSMLFWLIKIDLDVCADLQ